MDEIDDFFNRDKPVVRKKISGGTTNGRIKIDVPKKTNRSDEFASTSQYAEPHIAENQQQLMEVICFLHFSSIEDIVFAAAVASFHTKKIHFRDSMT